MNTFTLRCTFTFAAFIAAALASVKLSGQVTPSEQSTAHGWVAKHLTGDVAELPFSFNYGGRPSREILQGAKRTMKEDSLDANRLQRILEFTDVATGLVIRCVAIEYRDFPTVEWTLYFKNSGSKDSPILSNIRALNITIERDGDEEYVLHHNKGSRAEQDDFRPRTTRLDEGVDFRLRSLGGRGTNGIMPYFNLQGSTKGLIAVIGWPSQWDAQFQRDAGTKLHLDAGQETTHFKLLPNEEVRSPLIVLQFYEGSPERAQNIWRRWMVAHNMPRVDGELPPTQLVACSSHQFGEMIHANEENQKLFVDRYAEEKLGISHWWMDAGWYKNNGQWVNTGTWEVDPKRFPHGLRAITDHAHAKVIKTVVLLQPEPVTANSWLYDNHPEWLLTPPKNPGSELYDANWRLLDLGNPGALQWLVDHIDGLITSQGIDLYRQDFNVDPLLFWQAHEAPDRQGITEIKHVTGYLTYWDELRKRHPTLRLDTCASGGRRLDLETLRRSVPLVRSDNLFEPTGQQCHSYGLASWIPYTGTGTLIGKSAIGQNTSEKLDSYDFRSHMASSVTACWDMRRKDLDYNELRRFTGQLREAAPYFVLGDFYPLTPYSLKGDVWIAWQYNRPNEGTGIVQAFRREGNTETKQSFQLQGLDPAAKYELTVADNTGTPVVAKAELMGSNLTIEMPKPRSAALVFYRKK